MNDKKLKKELRSMVELAEFLKNPSPNLKVPVYTESEDEAKPVNKPKDRITLKQVIDMIQKLDTKVDAGFNELRQNIKDINARLDYNGLQIEQINKRLDYNGLQIEQINKRLDYNGLQIEQINKRLDYNQLKDLPKNTN